MTRNQNQTQTTRRIVLLFAVMGVLALGAAQSSASRADDKSAYDSWVGTWDLVTVGSAKYTLTIGQTRRGLYGNYSPGNGVITGRVYEGVLHVKWSQDGNLKGTGQFKLSEDGKSFSGEVKAEGKDDKYSWNGTRR